MIILGIGSNRGDRLSSLRRAIQLIREHPKIELCHISPVYQSDAEIEPNTPKAWASPLFSAAVSCKTNLSPYALLDELKQIEALLGYIKQGRRSSQMINLNILMWGELNISGDSLTIPDAELLKKPGMLWPLMDLYSNWNYPKSLLEQWGTRFEKRAPYNTYQLPYRIDGSVFMGVLNVTPDSFSDGGEFLECEAAVKQAKYLFESGAEIIDIGAESTRPGSVSITPEDEWSRINAVIQALSILWKGNDYRPKLSIDTRHYETAEKAAAIGVEWINDVTGFKDPKMISAVKSSVASLVCMHSLSLPPSQQNVISLNKDPVETVFEWGQQQLKILLDAGVAKERIIFDPGIGFGKTPEQNFILLKRAYELKKLGVPLLYAHSRKSYNQLVSAVGSQDRDLETSIASINLFNQGIEYIRAHNVEYNLRAIALHQRLIATPQQQELNHELPYQSQSATRSEALAEASIL